MANRIAHDDPRLEWAGAISTEANGEWTMPWRIPHEEKTLFAGELVERAAMPAGVRLSFSSDTSSIVAYCDTQAERSPVDLVIDGEVVGSAVTEDQSEFRFEGLGSGQKQIELWLPQYQPFRFKGLELSDNADIAAPGSSARPKWVTYGSSITQCRAADSPTLTWPAIVARTRGYDLTCLGFGGQCHLDPMVARIVRDSDADLISLCLGINIYGNGSLNARTFGPGIMGFVQIVREKHPATPIVLMSPIYSPGREDTLNDVGFTLAQMRGEVKMAAETLQAHGDEHIQYIDGLDIFDASKAHLLPDDLHPNSEGYGLMAQNLLKLLPEVS